MSTIRVSNIQHGSAGTAAITLNSAGQATLNGLNFPTAGALGNRNLIINGAMDIAQRTTGSVTATGQYPVDRFVTSFSVTSAAISAERQEEAPAGLFNSLRYRMTTAASAGAAEVNNIQYKVEGLDSRYLKWGTAQASNVTLSFWVRSSNAGTYCVSLRNDAGETRRSYVAEYTIAADDTWERITVPIDGDTGGTWLTTAQLGINITWDLGSGSNFNGTADSWLNDENRLNTSNQFDFAGTTDAAFYLTGVQLEIGDVATPFEHRGFDEELRRCSRYYQKSYAPGTDPGTATDTGSIGSRMDASTTAVQHPGTVFRHTMRAAPTVTLYSPQNGVADRVSDRAGTPNSHTNNGIVTSIFGAGHNGFTSIVLDAAEGPAITYHYTAEAEL